MKLTEKKLRRIIKEEMLNEFMGFGKKQPKKGSISSYDDIANFEDLEDIEANIENEYQQDLANKKLEDILLDFGFGKPKWVFVSPEHEHSYAIVDLGFKGKRLAVVVLKDSFIGKPRVVATGFLRSERMEQVKTGLEMGNWIRVFKNKELIGKPTNMNAPLKKWADMIDNEVGMRWKEWRDGVFASAESK